MLPPSLMDPNAFFAQQKGMVAGFALAIIGGTFPWVVLTTRVLVSSAYRPRAIRSENSRNYSFSQRTHRGVAAVTIADIFIFAMSRCACDVCGELCRRLEVDFAKFAAMSLCFRHVKLRTGYGNRKKGKQLLYTIQPQNCGVKTSRVYKASVDCHSRKLQKF
jgi:hypothetical protein